MNCETCGLVVFRNERKQFVTDFNEFNHRCKLCLQLDENTKIDADNSRAGVKTNKRKKYSVSTDHKNRKELWQLLKDNRYRELAFEND